MTNKTNSNIEYRYCLDNSSKKYFCPACNKKKFVRFIDRKTNLYLPSNYGRCDRESKCAYFLNPYENGYNNEVENDNTFFKSTLSLQSNSTTKPEIVYFDFNTFNQTLDEKRFKKNVFIQNLLSNVEFPFNVNDVNNVIEIYNLGTIVRGYREGATTFPFIDLKGNVRAIQVKQFNNENKTISTDFLHSILEKHYNRASKPLPNWLKKYLIQEKKITCLFGEHLLQKFVDNPIALVEAPKTAIYGTLYFGFPENKSNFLWIAVYNKSSFNYEKLKVLQGRFIYVFPDLSKNRETYYEWEAKAKEIEKKIPATKFIFSDILEQYALDEDKIKGKDLADYLIKLDWRNFR